MCGGGERNFVIWYQTKLKERTEIPIRDIPKELHSNVFEAQKPEHNRRVNTVYEETVMKQSISSECSHLAKKEHKNGKGNTLGIVQSI